MRFLIFLSLVFSTTVGAQVTHTSGDVASGLTNGALEFSSGTITVDAGELLIVGVGSRNTLVNAPDSVKLGSLKLTLIDEIGDSQSQESFSLYRGMPTSTITDVVTSYNPNANKAHAMAVAWFSGVDEGGTNGSVAVENDSTAEVGGTDSDLFWVRVRTITADARVLGGGNHRQKTFTAPSGETILIDQFAGGGGDKLSAVLWLKDAEVATPSTVLLGSDVTAPLNGTTDWETVGISIKKASAAAARRIFYID